MAVNDNDRVTSRRLKQFWDIAKTWITDHVSDAIDTSEAAMESSMDTKILAAKPDYTKPNINGQIGDGFGYNDMVGNYKSNNSYITFTNLETYFSGTSSTYPFKGNDLIGKQIAYLYSLYENTEKDKLNFTKDFLKGFEGKLVAFPKAMAKDENFDGYTEFISNLNNFKSTYIEEENCLLSPVWKYGENTYQTKLLKHPSNVAFTYYLSTNGSPFTAPTWSSGDGLAWCASYNNMPLNIGTGDVRNNSIGTEKIEDLAITVDKTDHTLRNRTLSNAGKQISTSGSTIPFVINAIKQSSMSSSSVELGVELSMHGAWDTFNDLAIENNNNEYIFNNSAGEKNLGLGAHCAWGTFESSNAKFSTYFGIAILITDDGVYYGGFNLYNPIAYDSTLDWARTAISFIDNNILAHVNENNAQIALNSNMRMRTQGA